MTMLEYIREVKKGLAAQHGFVPIRMEGDEPIFGHIPDGLYSMDLNGQRDHVRIVSGRIECCNFTDPRRKQTFEAQALVAELRMYLNGLSITSGNIGDIRRRCFLPWDSEWNGIVRDETAARENAKTRTRPEP